MDSLEIEAKAREALRHVAIPREKAHIEETLYKMARILDSFREGEMVGDVTSLSREIRLLSKELEPIKGDPDDPFNKFCEWLGTPVMTNPDGQIVTTNRKES